jgi:hypothetical protein
LKGRISESAAIYKSGVVNLYHPTRHAAEILRDGFGERSGAYLTATDHSGVWLFDQRLEQHVIDKTLDVILELEMPESVAAPFEWHVGLPYRQFLMPAALVNLYGPPRVTGGPILG